MDPRSPRLAALFGCALLLAVGLALVGLGQALEAVREVAINSRREGTTGSTYGGLAAVGWLLVAVGGVLAAVGLAGAVVLAVTA